MLISNIESSNVFDTQRKGVPRLQGLGRNILIGFRCGLTIHFHLPYIIVSIANHVSHVLFVVVVVVFLPLIVLN